MAHDVFISYSSLDKPVADAVCAGLESAKIRCWIAPRDVRPGLDYASEIINAIKSCRVLVVVFSSHSESSKNVLTEVERAMHYDVPIIPLRIEDVTPTGSFEYFLGSPHWLDALTPPLESHIVRLASAVAALMSATEWVPTEERAPTESAPGPPRPEAVGQAPSSKVEAPAVSDKQRRRVLAIGLIAAISLAAVGVGGVLLLGRDRDLNSGDGIAQDGGDAGTGGDQATQAEVRTYAEVIESYPANAPIVGFEAIFDEIAIYGDNEGYYIPIHGEYEGVPIRGAFTVSQDGTYMGSPGVLWEMYGDTLMPGWPPGSAAWDWADYEAVVVPLAERDPAFASLYYDTFSQMWGPRLTSNTRGSVGGLQVLPGDKLTFDSSLRLVKVSEW